MWSFSELKQWVGVRQVKLPGMTQPKQGPSSGADDPWTVEDQVGPTLAEQLMAAKLEAQRPQQVLGKH